MKIVVFTDLDATLLDPHTYSWKAAGPSLDALNSMNALLVLVSSKTVAEMAPIHAALSLNHPFVAENGGGIAALPDEAFRAYLTSKHGLVEPFEKAGFHVFPLGTRYAHLVRCLGEVSHEVDVDLIGFSSLSDAEISRLTGLSIEEAALARDRDFDEPFFLPKDVAGKESAIQDAAKRRGLAVVQGGRFGHLIGHDGKGTAVSILIDALTEIHGRIVSIGLGDSPNDFAFLELVDFPVLVTGRNHKNSKSSSPARARRTKLPGPEGWNEAVLEIISELEHN